jgi:hypothetical protein
VNRVIDEKDRPAFSSEIARQLKTELPDVASIQILQYFSYQDWRVIYVDTQVSDEVFLIFNGSPLKGNYLDLLAGAYTMDDGKFIRDQLEKGKSKGIPPKLAKCIAWHITKARDM